MSDASGPMLIVVLPAYDEAVAIPRLLARFQEVLPSLSLPSRILVVDDGSADGTAAAAAAFVTARAPVVVIRHPKNRGLHAAIDTGFRAALPQLPEDGFVLMMDADDTHPPDLIPLMLEHAARGRDVVIASRFEQGAEWHGRTFDRILFSYSVSWMLRLAFPMGGVKDYTCGYRLYRASILRAAYARWGENLLAEDSFACVLDLLLRLGMLGAKVSEVPLPLHYDRKPGKSKMDVTRTVRRILMLMAKRRVGSFR